MDALITRALFAGCFLLLISLCLGCGDTAQSDEGALRFSEPLDEQQSIVAVIESPFGTDTLTAEAFDGLMQRLTEMFPQVMFDPEQVPTVKAGLVNQFIMDHLLIGEAERRGLVVGPDQVEEELTQFRQQFDSDSAFRAAFPADTNEEAMRAKVARDMLPRMVLNAMMQNVDALTNEEVEVFAAEHSKQVRAQHILFLVPEEAGAAEKRAIRRQARTVLDSAQTGIDFSSLARRHSEDPGSASRGGDLGFFRKGEMVVPFEEAAFALESPGDVTRELVETSYGYHIIKLVDTEQKRCRYRQHELLCSSSYSRKHNARVSKNSRNRRRFGSTPTWLIRS